MDQNKLNLLLNKLNLIDDEELKSLIFELIEERDHLFNSANYDHLTGTYNRRIIDKIHEYSVVVMCDINNFKKINDTYGHQKGDEILKLVTNEFKKRVRNNDIICRYGGDEFLLVFSNCDVDVVINRLYLIKRELDKINIVLSYGISKYDVNKTIYEVIKEADEALYNSKQDTNNDITIYKSKSKVNKLS